MRLIALILAAALGCGCAAAFTGTGTWDDPYMISTAADMVELSAATNDGKDFAGKYLLFACDIDVSGADFAPLSADSACPFRGVLDGGGHSLLGWTVDGSATTSAITDAPSALVVWLGEGGAVLNLTIDASCRLRPTGNFAPLAYDVRGTLNNCINRAAVVAEHDVAGIACRVQPGGQVSACYNEGDIAGVRYGLAAGIVATNAGVVSRCMNVGTVTAADYALVGGIAGENRGAINNCMSAALLKGASAVGGLVAVAGAGSSLATSLCTAVLCPVGADAVAEAIVARRADGSEVYVDLCYDSQITIFNTIKRAGITAATTQQLVDTLWSGSRAWTHLPGRYPMLWQFHTEPAARLAASPLVMADGDTRLTMTRPALPYADLTDSLWWTLDGGDAFALDDEGCLVVARSAAEQSTTITAHHSGYSRNIPIVAPALPDVEMVNWVINAILQTSGLDDSFDINRDGVIDVDDVNAIVNIILEL